MKTWMNFARILPLLFLVGILDGCGTHTPKRVVAKQASISDTGKADSGVVAFVGPVNNRQVLVTKDHVDTYNTLAAQYGSKLVPPIHANDGVSKTPSNLFLMTKRAEMAKIRMTILANNTHSNWLWSYVREKWVYGLIGLLVTILFIRLSRRMVCANR